MTRTKARFKAKTKALLGDGPQPAHARSIEPGSRSIQNHERRTVLEELMRQYRNETRRQKLIVRRARLAQMHMAALVNSLKRLLADAPFVSLLCEAGIQTLPKVLADRLYTK